MKRLVANAKHSLRKVNDSWHLLSWKGLSVDDLIWRVWTIQRSLALSVDRRLGAEHWTPLQENRSWQGSVSVIDLKFSTWCWRVLNRHGNRDGCLAGLSGFWFEILSVEGFSSSATSLTLIKYLHLHAARCLWSSFLFPPLLPSQLSKAITALWCKSFFAIVDKGWEVVSNDGSTSDETSQSCLFQQ